MFRMWLAGVRAFLPHRRQCYFGLEIIAMLLAKTVAVEGSTEDWVYWPDDDKLIL